MDEDIEPLSSNAPARRGDLDAGEALVKSQMYAAYLSHVLVLAIIITVGIWVSDEAMGGGGVSWSQGDAKRVFNWHPVLMVTAFSFMTIASLAFRAPYRCADRRATKAMHGTQWAVASICAIVGITAVVKSHNDPVSGYIANLYSLHSWVGIAVIILYSCQFIAGVMAFALDMEFITPSMRANLLLLHKYVGPFVYNATALTIMLGIQEKEGFIGCGYKVETVDSIPITHFFDIPAVCRTGHALGLLVFILALCTSYALHDFGRENIRSY